MSLTPSSMAATNDPGNRAEPADRNDNQHINEIGQRERRIEPEHGDGERAAEAGKTAAERKGDREQAVDVDAEAARHALIVHRRAHLRAESRRIPRVTTSRTVISKAAPIRNSR